MAPLGLWLVVYCSMVPQLTYALHNVLFMDDGPNWKKSGELRLSDVCPQCIWPNPARSRLVGILRGRRAAVAMGRDLIPWLESMSNMLASPKKSSFFPHSPLSRFAARGGSHPHKPVTRIVPGANPYLIKIPPKVGIKIYDSGSQQIFNASISLRPKMTLIGTFAYASNIFRDKYPGLINNPFELQFRLASEGENCMEITQVGNQKSTDGYEWNISITDLSGRVRSSSSCVSLPNPPAVYAGYTIHLRLSPVS